MHTHKFFTPSYTIKKKSVNFTIISDISEHITYLEGKGKRKKKRCCMVSLQSVVDSLTDNLKVRGWRNAKYLCSFYTNFSHYNTSLTKQKKISYAMRKLCDHKQYPHKSKTFV